MVETGLMRAIEILAPGGPENLRLCQRAIPVPSAGEVLIQVIAAGVNRPDIMQRQGLYPAPPGASDIPGLEVAGTVHALGSKISKYRIGDKVCALLTGGGYADFALAAESLCLPLPENLSAIQAAAIPETFFTVWHNLFQRAQLKRGETFLVHGGTSGIGTAAIQIANAFGAKVFATAGSDEKCQVCRDLGADLAINYKRQDFVTEVKSATDDKGVDVILDMVGGSYIERNMRAAARKGRILSIAFLEGAKVEVDLMPLLVKRLSLLGSTLRRQSVEEKSQIAAALSKQVWPLLEAGKVRPLIDSLFPLEQAADAHRLMESGLHMGKIVLTLTDAE